MENRDITLDEKQKLWESDSGYVIYKLDDDWCEICYIEVDNVAKNNGAGTLMLNSFISEMKEKGVHDFDLDAWLTPDVIYKMDVLVGFYEKFGFKEVDRMEEEGAIRIFMNLDIVKEEKKDKITPIPNLETSTCEKSKEENTTHHRQ